MSVRLLVVCLCVCVRGEMGRICRKMERASEREIKKANDREKARETCLWVIAAAEARGAPSPPRHHRGIRHAKEQHHLYIYIYKYTYTYMFVCTYIYMYTHRCVYIYIYIYICVCIYIYIYI